MPDDDILADLDFEVTMECETTSHEHYGTGPALWVVEFRCPGCGNRERFAICLGCWTSSMTEPGGGFRCTLCYAAAGVWAWFYEIVSIGGVA